MSLMPAKAAPAPRARARAPSRNAIQTALLAMTYGPSPFLRVTVRADGRCGIHLCAGSHCVQFLVLSAVGDVAGHAADVAGTAGHRVLRGVVRCLGVEVDRGVVPQAGTGEGASIASP